MDDQELKISEYYDVLKNNILLMVIVFIAIFWLVLAYTFFSSPIYEARSLVVVTTQDPTSQLLGQTNAIKVDIATQMEIIQSASILGAVEEQYLDQFDVSIEAIKNSNVIEITSESPDPMIAMITANSIAENYVNYTVSTKKDDALRVSELISDQLQDYKDELKELNTKISAITQKNQTNLTNSQKAELQNLNQELAAKDKLYNYLLSRREESGITAQEKFGNVKIIEYAVMPEKPVKPNISLNLILGFILAMLGALGAAFLRDYFNDNFRSINEVEKEFGPIIMGTLPKFKGTNEDLSTHKAGEVRESISRLKTNLMFYLRDNKIKLIAVTSPQRGSGTTTTAKNLAQSMAMHQAKVLFIDANIRHPFGEDMEKNTKKGLTDVLLGEVDIKGAITHSKKMDILLPGTPNINPAELLDSHKMKEICADLKKSAYDLVIFDCASLQYSESVLLSGNVEGVVVVVRQHYTSKELTAKAKRSLHHAKARIVGVVVNSVK